MKSSPLNNMALLIILILSILSFIAWDIFETRRLIAIGLKLADNAIPFSRDASGPKILVIGDSTAVGTGASASSTSLAGLLGSHYPSASIENRGINGSKTRDLLTRNDLSGDRYDLIMIHIGGNDTVRFTNLDELTKDIALVIDDAKNTRTTSSSSRREMLEPLASCRLVRAGCSPSAQSKYAISL